MTDLEGSIISDLHPLRELYQPFERDHITKKFPTVQFAYPNGLLDYLTG